MPVLQLTLVSSAFGGGFVLRGPVLILHFLPFLNVFYAPLFIYYIVIIHIVHFSNNMVIIHILLLCNYTPCVCRGRSNEYYFVCPSNARALTDCTDERTFSANTARVTLSCTANGEWEGEVRVGEGGQGGWGYEGGRSQRGL